MNLKPLLQTVLIFTALSTTLQIQAATTFEEDLAKLKLKHHKKAEKERIKKIQQKEKDELKIKHKLEILKLETDLATKPGVAR